MKAATIQLGSITLAPLPILVGLNTPENLGVAKGMGRAPILSPMEAFCIRARFVTVKLFIEGHIKADRHGLGMGIQPFCLGQRHRGGTDGFETVGVTAHQRGAGEKIKNA